MDGIKAGSVVQLKSGGPQMTVLKVAHIRMIASRGPASAWCYWFTGEEAPLTKQNGIFPLISLKLLEP